MFSYMWVDKGMDGWTDSYALRLYEQTKQIRTCVCIYVCTHVCCGICRITSSVSSAVQPGWVWSFPASKLLMNSLHLWYLNKGEWFLNFTATIHTPEDVVLCLIRCCYLIRRCCYLISYSIMQSNIAYSSHVSNTGYVTWQTNSNSKCVNGQFYLFKMANRKGLQKKTK